MALYQSRSPDSEFDSMILIIYAKRLMLRNWPKVLEVLEGWTHCITVHFFCQNFTYKCTWNKCTLTQNQQHRPRAMKYHRRNWIWLQQEVTYQLYINMNKMTYMSHTQVPIQHRQTSTISIFQSCFHHYLLEIQVLRFQLWLSHAPTHACMHTHARRHVRTRTRTHTTILLPPSSPF